MKNWLITQKETLQKLFGRSSKTKLIKVFLLTTLGTLLLLICFFWLFQIREVEVKTVTGKNAPHVGAQKIIGEYIFRSDSFLKKVINSAETEFEVVELQRHYPGKVTVILTEIPGVAYLENNGTYVVLSEKAKILSRQNDIPNAMGEIKIPSTYIAKPLRVGESIDFREVVFAAKIAKVIKSNAIAAFKIEILDSNLIICTLPTTNTVIKFSSMLNFDQSISRLSDFLEKLYTSGKAIKSLDLRFEKAIIEENK